MTNLSTEQHSSFVSVSRAHTSHLSPQGPDVTVEGNVLTFRGQTPAQASWRAEAVRGNTAVATERPHPMKEDSQMAVRP